MGPCILDHTSTNPDWYNVIKRLDDGLMKTPFDMATTSPATYPIRLLFWNLFYLMLSP
jgi:hypothetical protein